MTLGLSGGAQAATELAGPINLGTAVDYAVLAGSTVTNDGSTVVTGDVGLSPGTEVTGFEGAPAGSIVAGTGSIHINDAPVIQAKKDLVAAFDTAARLTPQASGLSQLAGKTLKPGVYSGGALDLASGGSLTLQGGAESVWVFQAASTLVTGSGSSIQVIGGASICNVFWKVGSSATLGGASNFVGTILAQESVSAGNAAVIQGRLLANTSAVTLLNDTITRPSGCTAGTGTVETTKPDITSDTPPDATIDTPYTHTIEVTGKQPVTITVTDGQLPPGLTLTDGVISGVPTTTGTYTFTVTATNDNTDGGTDDVTAIYTIVTREAPPTPPTETPVTPNQNTGSGTGGSLAATGFEAAGPIAGAALLLAAGLLFTIRATRRRA